LTDAVVEKREREREREREKRWRKLRRSLRREGEGGRGDTRIEKRERERPVPGHVLPNASRREATACLQRIFSRM
jgi:hypothetical protein